MKIALCLSGQPRSIKESFGYIKNNLMIPNNITDVFIHTWWRPEWKDKTFINHHSRPNHNFSGTEIEDIKRLYSPKSLLVENDLDYHEHVKKEYAENDDYISQEKLNIINTYFGYYSTFKVNELKNKYGEENGIKYDMIVKTRLDICPLKILSLQHLDSSKLHVPTVGFGGTEKDLGDLFDVFHVNDIFGVSNKENMDIFCDVVNNLKEIAKRVPDQAGNGTLGNILAHNNVKVHISWLDRQDINIYRNLKII